MSIRDLSYKEIGLHKFKLLLLMATTVCTFFLTACSSQPVDPEVIAQEQAEQRERCKQLQQDIEDLKGKPVRRGAAIEYYNSECMMN